MFLFVHSNNYGVILHPRRTVALSVIIRRSSCFSVLLSHFVMKSSKIQFLVFGSVCRSVLQLYLKKKKKDITFFFKKKVISLVAVTGVH